MSNEVTIIYRALLVFRRSTAPGPDFYDVSTAPGPDFIEQLGAIAGALEALGMTLHEPIPLGVVLPSAEGIWSPPGTSDTDRAAALRAYRAVRVKP